MANNPQRIPVRSLGTPLGEAQPVWTNLTAAGTGATLAASGTSGTTLIQTWGYSRLLLIVYVAGTVSGAGASMTVSLAGYAADLPAQITAQAGAVLGTSAAITSTGTALAVSAGPGAAGNYVIPPLTQVTWTLTGTNPSFGNTQMSLWGR